EQSQQRDDRDHDRLQHRVDRERQKTAAGGRQRVLQRNLVGSVDGKLFRCRQRPFPPDRSRSGSSTGPVSRRCWREVSKASRALLTTSCVNWRYCIVRPPPILPPRARTALSGGLPPT